MSKVSITRSLLDDLAMSISAKSGEAVPMTLTEMKDAVDSIQGGGTTIDALSVTSNGTYTAQSGHAYSPVTVNVPTPSLQAKTYTVDSAGTETITADSGYDGLSSVQVSVPSASPYIGDATAYFTLSGQRKWRHNFEVAVEVPEGDVAGWLPDGYSQNRDYSCDAIPTGTSVTPTTSSQTIGGAGYMMEGAVTINPIPIDYVNLPKFTVDLTANPATATCTKTYAECVALYNNDYKANATADVTTQGGVLHVATSAVEYQLNAYMRFTVYTERGVPVIDLIYYPNELIMVVNPSAMIVEAGTPTATKGAVSNHSVSVTPSVTNTTGYITGSTKTGTAVTVTASELVSGDLAITQNGNNIDCANYSTVSVNVPASGGSEWTHIAHTTLTVNTTSTSAATAGTISCGTSIVDKDKIIYVRIRDQEGARAGYFAGSDAYFMNYNKANGSTSAFAVPAVLCYRYTTSSAWAGTAGQYGVYGYSISNAGVLTVRRRYNSNYSLTINSTYDVDVFTLDYPTGYPAVFDS